MKKDYSNIPKEKLKLYQEFMTACMNDELENVKELLSNPNYKTYIENRAIDNGFKWCCGDGFLDIIQYLIFDYNIVKSNDIKKHLKTLVDTKNENGEKINNMFAIRELNEKLKQELPSNVVKNKRSKL